MRHEPIKSNFIYPTIRPTDFRLGALEQEVLREDGDWRDFIPQDEPQRRHGIESSSCYIQAQQRAIATILEETHGVIDSNFSERFNFILSNGTQWGGNPIEGADSIRKDGLIPDNILPFSELIASWDEFNSWKGGHEVLCKSYGQKFLEQWGINYEIVFLRDEPIEEKYKKLSRALKYSPVPMSVYGWIEENGVYVKTEELADNHLALCVYLDENNCSYILDTYEPYIKKLQPFYPSDFAMSLSVKKKIVEKPKSTFWQRVVQWMTKEKSIFKWFYNAKQP